MDFYVVVKHSLWVVHKLSLVNSIVSKMAYEKSTLCHPKLLKFIRNIQLTAGSRILKIHISLCTQVTIEYMRLKVG